MFAKMTTYTIFLSFWKIFIFLLYLTTLRIDVAWVYFLFNLPHSPQSQLLLVFYIWFKSQRLLNYLNQNISTGSLTLSLKFILLVSKSSALLLF